MTSGSTGKALATEPGETSSANSAVGEGQPQMRGRHRGRARLSGEGLTALVVEVVHSTLRGVIKIAGFVDVGTSSGEQQRRSEVQSRRQSQCPGVGSSPAPLSLLQAAGQQKP